MEGEIQATMIIMKSMIMSSKSIQHAQKLKKRKKKIQEKIVINSALHLMSSVQLLLQPSFPFGDAMPLRVMLKLMKLFLTSISNL